MTVRLDRELMEIDLSEHLIGREGAGVLPRSEQAQLKTYLVEAHEAESSAEAVTALEAACQAVNATLQSTDDPTLLLMLGEVELDGAREEAGFWVDVANPRFWLLHTKTTAKPAQAVLKRVVLASKGLDFGWLPRNQLRLVQRSFRPFGFRLGFDERPFYAGTDVVELAEPTHKLNVEHAGVGAEQMYDLLRQSPITRRAMAVSEVAFSDRSAEGTQLLRINRQGRLRSTGSSLTSHLQAARTLVRSYESFVMSLEEAFGLRFALGEEELLIEGQTLGVAATQPEGFEFRQLVHRMFSGVEPFRLLGTVDWRDDDLAWVESVDLHTATPLRVDVTPEWIRLYLRRDSCGNTLARFVTNLQRSYNADLGFFDPETEAVFDPLVS